MTDSIEAEIREFVSRKRDTALGNLSYAECELKRLRQSVQEFEQDVEVSRARVARFDTWLNAREALSSKSDTSGGQHGSGS